MAIVTLTGPTCAGKSTVEAALQKLGFGRAISHTTRPPRAGEVDGNAYHFVSNEEFDRLNAAGEFIETVEFGSYKYAMSAKSLKTAQAVSPHVVIVVEPVGAKQIHNFCAEYGMPSIAVWVDCSYEAQAKRWLERLTFDLIIKKGGPIAPYENRLSLMLGEETQWRRDAYSAWSMVYELMFDSTVLSPGQIAGSIQSHALK